MDFRVGSVQEGVVCFAERATYVCGERLQAATREHVQTIFSALPRSPSGGASLMEGIMAAARMTPTPMEIFALADGVDACNVGDLLSAYGGRLHLRYPETADNQACAAWLRAAIESRGGTVRSCALRS